MEQIGIAKTTVSEILKYEPGSVLLNVMYFNNASCVVNSIVIVSHLVH